MADASAPQCLLPNRSQAPAMQPGRRYAAIPHASDLLSAIVAVQALTAAIELLLDTPLPQPNNLNPFTTQSLSPTSGGTSGIVDSYANGPGGGKGANGEDAKRQRYKESGRTEQHIKVVNPDDEEQYVFVSRISSIEFADNETGSTFTWEGIDLG